MHNRNPVVSDSEVVYFEYGNNGQPDLLGTTGPGPHDRLQQRLPGGDQDRPQEASSSRRTTRYLEDDLFYYRKHNGSYTVGGDLEASVRARHDLSATPGGMVVFGTTAFLEDEDLYLWSPSA